MARTGVLERGGGGRRVRINAKGLVVLAACALWSYRSLPALLAGFAAPNVAVAVWLWADGAAELITSEVWKWGRIYAARTFVEQPAARTP